MSRTNLKQSMEPLKVAQQETPVSKHLSITHLNEPTIFELSNGQVGCTLCFTGVPFDTATNDELNTYKRTLHHAIYVLSETFCIYQTTLRRKMPVSLSGKFANDFLSEVDTIYHQQFQQQHLYRNELYVTLLYKGLSSGKWAKGLTLLQKITHQAVKSSREQYRDQAIGELKKASQQFASTLSRFKPHLLGSHDAELGYSELLTFHATLVNGLEQQQFKNPRYANPKLKGFQKGVEILQRYPDGNVASLLPTKRLFFGDYIEFKGPAGESRFGAMLSLKEYGTDTGPIMLDPLLQLDCEFITTNTFAIEPSDQAQKKIMKQIIKLENAEDPAVTLLAQLGQCRDDLASGRLKLGYHHNSVMLVSDDLSHLKKQILKAIKIYSDIAYTLVQESIGQEAAFWAQMPGNQKYIVRGSLITSQNFVDFCPLHNYRTGYCNQNHLGKAVTLIETPSKTPMFFNYHAKGSGDKNDLTPGHTTIIGGNGSGKTVFMGFMDSQMSRYGGRSFFFDRDRGMEIYIRAAGGRYAIISPNHPQDVQFNPFWLDDTPSNRSFLKTWLGHLVKTDNEHELPAGIDRDINHCIDYAYDALSKAHRNLTTATKMLPVDFPRWDRLKKWLRSDGIHNAGEYAYLFDHDTDQVDLAFDKVGFDFTDLMNQPHSVLTAVCMYLVHRLKESLDGQRVSIYFDEGWQILDNPYWKVQLKQDLPTLRKLNAHIILATQSPESVVNSSLSAQFLDNCATTIFFCNAKANYEKHYQHFNVSSSEFDFIKYTPREKRLFLYKQSEDSSICRLNLGHMTKALNVYSANRSTIMLLDQLRAQVGDDPKAWLPLFHEGITNMQEEVA